VVRFIPEGNCSVAFQGREITIPRESLGIFFEVSLHRVYEQFPGPKRGDIVIDVGAHVGTFTVNAAKLVGDKGLVVAIEPEPSNLALLQRNIDSQNLNNVKVIRKAVWDKAAKLWLYLSKHSGLHSLCYASGDRVEVEAESLDNIVSKLGLSQVDFVKIDVEGAEIEVLKGAERILAPPGIKLSIAAYHAMPDGQPELPVLVSYLASRQFRTHVYTIFEGPYIYATKQE